MCISDRHYVNGVLDFRIGFAEQIPQHLRKKEYEATRIGVADESYILNSLL